MKGLARCVVGYSGGVEPNPNYEAIKDYTESLLIEYDPTIITYKEILEEWSRMDYPFVQSKRQYRSALFFLSEEQQTVAASFVAELQKKAEPGQTVYTDVEPVTKCFRAEEYHQEVLKKQRSLFH